MSGITVLSDCDLDLDILNPALIGFSRPSVTSHCIVYNNIGMTILAIDMHGISKAIPSIELPDRLLHQLRLPAGYRGVVVVEYKRLTKTDLSSSAYQYGATKGIVDYHISSKLVQSTILNKRVITEDNNIYIITHIEEVELRLKQRMYVRGAELLLTTSIMNCTSPVMAHIESLFNIKSNSNMGYVSGITYYGVDDGCVYMNQLGEVTALPAIHDVGRGECVVVRRMIQGVLTERVIEANDFTANGVFLTIREAKNAMSLENTISNRKLDLEVMKAEHGMLSHMVDTVANKYKATMDMNNRMIQLGHDKQKYLHTTYIDGVKIRNLKKGEDNMMKSTDMLFGLMLKLKNLLFK